MKKQDFNDNWTFTKLGSSSQPVTLPHDAMQYEDRLADSEGGRDLGYYTGGVYTYQKTFFAEEELADKIVLLEFEGVYPNAKVYLNDNEVAHSDYGYNFFRADLSQLKIGFDNTIRVEVDNSQVHNSRWYSGAGIYRPVYLLTSPQTHIAPDGIKVTTVDYHTGCIHVETIVIGDDNVYAQVTISDSEGPLISEIGTDLALTVERPKLWNHLHPYLYNCTVELVRDGEIIDTHTTKFGIRQLAWSATEGFLVNGESVKLQGGCLHHDNGILGARTFKKAEYRQIERLKTAGFNAIRSSHNPLCRYALEACDELGMYVMDELWDMWFTEKTPADYSRHFMAHYQDDIRNLVAKDYNHPSVVMYSIGNEVTEPAKQEGLDVAQSAVDLLHELDVTRPVTCGINLTLLMLSTLENNPLAAGGEGDMSKMTSTEYNKMAQEAGQRMNMVAAAPQSDEVASPVLDMLDIAGYNYATSRYEMDKELHPDRIIVGTETYCHELPQNWAMVEKYPHLIGDFMWTAWDYLGEAGIGGWSYEEEDASFNKAYPWLLADVGAFDLIGHETAEAGIAAITWGAQTNPYIAVQPVHKKGEPSKAVWRGTNARPSWSYKNCDGKPAHVEVYSRAYEIELFVNGASQGRKLLENSRADFEVTYVSGEVSVISYEKNGTVQGESKLLSADPNTHIRLKADQEIVQVGDIVYVAIDLVGDNGIIESNADTTIELDVIGAELLAFGSAQPKTEETFTTHRHSTYYGSSLAVIRVTSEHLTMTATSDDYSPATLSI